MKWSQTGPVKWPECIVPESALLPPPLLLQASEKRDSTGERWRGGQSRKTKWETEKMENKGDTDEEKKWGKEEGELYLDNLIISHLQSTSMDAPSLHQAAHCEDRASGAGQPVDFPLSLSQRGPACPYISRSGHADSHGHPSAATQQYHTTMTPGIKYYPLICDALTISACSLQKNICHIWGTLAVQIAILEENTLNVLHIILNE